MSYRQEIVWRYFLLARPVYAVLSRPCWLQLWLVHLYTRSTWRSNLARRH